ncbi:MAG: hypothetical protein ED557_08630 [Balneola sp.]|nr:MAG: hypothetical protein ED557_08630 [Balneola sp.]
MNKLLILTIVPIIALGCKSSENFTGFSYDPPGVTNTTGVTTKQQAKRVIGVGTPKVWVGNEFEGARANDFVQLNEDTYQVTIYPENAPINNSPWFAFSIWSDSSRAINLKLLYKSGKHRYKPKITGKTQGVTYTHIIEQIEYDTTDGSVTFALHVDSAKKTVSAHFMNGILFSDLQKSHQSLPDFVTVDTVGFSHMGFPILEYTSDAPEPGLGANPVLVLLSRQHPPEVAGYRAFQSLWRELISDSELAKSFRNHVTIKAYPMVNPDGVVNGHWRHNFKGVDLNRDWENFNQPETKAIRDALVSLVSESEYRVFYGIDFHSTNENILYPILEEVVTTPDNFTQRWASIIKEEHPDLYFRTEEFDTNSPIAKNWIYHSFGADAVTFEVEDELDQGQIHLLGVQSAQSLMTLLLKELENTK